MKKNITFNEFADSFNFRPGFNQFTPSALRALYYHLEKTDQLTLDPNLLLSQWQEYFDISILMLRFCNKNQSCLEFIRDFKKRKTVLDTETGFLVKIF